jgi:hypothetical protein
MRYRLTINTIDPVVIDTLETLGEHKSLYIEASLRAFVDTKKGRDILMRIKDKTKSQVTYESINKKIASTKATIKGKKLNLDDFF